MDAYEYATDCVSANGADITAMVDRARPIEHSTFRRRLGPDNYNILSRQLGYTTQLPQLALATDYHVRFYSSRYQNRPCVYVVHSAIEYVYVRPREA